METLFLYLMKSSGLIAVFFGAYYFLLRKETFFKSNRWFLMLGLVTSILLPLVTFKKVIWVAPTKQAPSVNVNWAEIPVPMHNILEQQPETFEINWILVGAGIYLIGIFIFFFKFVFDFSGLIKALRGKTVRQQADFKFIDVNENVSPFSYFNYIVYNSSMYTENELENILEHEKVHCEQNHSVDVLISRVFCILFWYNPFMWLYQKAILQNLEFIADSEALKNISDKKAYQFTLLKVTTHDNCVAITNHFYQSLIKKRIIMLNKNQSKKTNSWKYALIIPALAAFLFYFQVKVIAQEKNSPIAVAAPAPIPSDNIVVNKNTTDAELKQYAETIKNKGGKLKFSKVKRNSAGEIVSIKVDYKDNKGSKGAYNVNGDEPIKPININRKDNGSIALGNGGDKTVRIIRKDHNEGDAVGGDEEEGKPAGTYSYTFSSSDADSDDESEDFNFNFDMPELQALADLDDVKTNVSVKTFKGKDGKMTVIVNGEEINIDTDKIMANIDIEKIQEQAEKSVRMAKKQIEAARPQMARARIKAREAQAARAESEDEMQEARQALEESRQALEESRKELEESRKEFERQRQALQAKRSKKQTK